MHNPLPRRLSAAVEAVHTPAFVLDHARLESSLRAIRALLDPLGCRLLYSLKALPLASLLRTLSQGIHGVSVSSPFEMQLAQQVLGDVSVHFTAPGLRPSDIRQVAAGCDYIACNSWNQYVQLRGWGDASLGMRVNVGIDFVGDPRCAPCRKHSKLGIASDTLDMWWLKGKDLSELEGLHIHHNSSSRKWSQLADAVDLTVARVARVLPRLRWLNLGGGYLFERATGVEDLATSVAKLREVHGLEVFMEPGAALAAPAGFLVASVVDLFESDGLTVAVLDTSINHHPNVFAYRYSPRVLNATRGGSLAYLLAGCSCLAGDGFGIHRFRNPLELGSRIVFPSTGAYTLAKANMFNGIPLPTIYDLRADGTLSLRSACRFEHFSSIFDGGGPAVDAPS